MTDEGSQRMTTRTHTMTIAPLLGALSVAAITVIALVLCGCEVDLARERGDEAADEAEGDEAEDDASPLDLPGEVDLGEPPRNWSGAVACETASGPCLAELARGGAWVQVVSECKLGDLVTSGVFVEAPEVWPANTCAAGEPAPAGAQCYAADSLATTCYAPILGAEWWVMIRPACEQPPEAEVWPDGCAAGEPIAAPLGSIGCDGSTCSASLGPEVDHARIKLAPACFAEPFTMEPGVCAG